MAIDKDTTKKYREEFSKVSNPKTSKQWEKHNKLLPVISELDNLEQIDNKIGQAREISSTETDPELLKMAQDDLKQLQLQKDTVLDKLNSITKQEKNQDKAVDSSNAIIEIRAGAGGDEASLFARDLFRMYLQYAERKGFKVKIVNRSLTDTNGIKEITAKITGQNAFGILKNESGVHRVQRIPVTESSGRIHTSTASVAVLPLVKDVSIDIKEHNLNIEVFRSSGPGGQSVNKTDSAVRITHIPTGIAVSCQEGKSQLRNRETAMTILKSRIYEMQRQKRVEKL
ncbi:MAG: PCRF domain-containing protein, partial [Patescibacteria group bacterium]|nr:PCRF domain-containing protein [Patescibacteria group bacterium]